MSMAPAPTSAQVEQICKVLGDTHNGLTGSEIGRMLSVLSIADIDPSNTKWKRLYNALADRANGTGKTTAVYGLVQYCFDPARGIDNGTRYRWMMNEVNQVLMLLGIEVRDDGKLHKVQVAKTLNEVERRTRNLRKALVAAGAHSEVLNCCREELLVDDYFHAVLEASKSLCARIKAMSKLDLDGSRLFDKALNVKNPYIALNTLQTESERNQQNGLREMLNGVMHLFRNPTAHELRIRWDINERDAVEVLSLISLLHKLLDGCVIVPRP
ncbi:TIGR02391 family protein [Collinsella ihumii]|uniref:TIGR02391 family protein n=1 Tax=Collinsella ihumii TaxID=1720204 RepID=A0AAW7JWN4_9ACTN|nr:TIGR02391 family protein [Collinsella ihumii]MDN0070021.1 TIGR02391 family protein [Collinsella ihumii]